MDELDARILAAVTRRGRRLLTVNEILQEGATYPQIVHRVRRKRWQRPHDTVILIGAGELSWEEKLLAAVMAGDESAAAGFRAASRVHGIGEFGKKLLEVSIRHGTELVADDVLVHRTRRPTPAVIVNGIPCTSVEETLLDLASVLPPRKLHQALTTAWRKHLTHPKRVLEHIEKYGGRGVKGTPVLRDLAKLYELCERGPGSEAEADLVHILFPALDEAGIERPVLQGVIKLPFGRVVSVDSLWPARAKVVEVMGLGAHGDYARQDDDIERAAAIRAAGYSLKEVTPRAIRKRPEATVASIIRFLEA